MKMLMNVRIPHEPFNTLIRENKVGEIIQKIINELKPEIIYFTEQGGTRGAVAIVNINDASQIPSFSEPFFLKFNADCEFRIAMSPEDLAKSGLDELGKKWRLLLMRMWKNPVRKSVKLNLLAFRLFNCIEGGG